MYVFIAADGTVSLRESDNMRAFSIVEEVVGAAANRLANFAIPADDLHFWLEADAVIELSGRRNDAQWVADFWDMLARVEAYGYSDLANKRVKAHVEHS